jgi:hypothetical protein
MIDVPIYEVNLYLNGTLIGDCRPIAENLNYARSRTKLGADSIDFTINDKLFDEWCRNRNTTINQMLKPIALECRLTRDGIAVVGGFLATMPAYQPLNASADLTLHFDGFLNLLGGVYIRDTMTNLPLGTITGSAGSLVSQMIMLAENISSDAGKAYGFSAGNVDAMTSITHTFDNYKTVKDWICDRCDNTSGAGPFDVYFDADKTYNIYADANFGDVITDWVAYYPTLLNNTSATSISASEVGGFASAIIGIGSGEISANPDENTALYEFVSDITKIADYGYYENLYQQSSISTSAVMVRNITAKLNNTANPIWQPEITLHGRQVAPKPTGSNKIWVGDTITINNSVDLTGMTNGQFRVNQLKVAISATGDETISPVLERVNV